MTPKTVKTVCAILAKANPNPKTELIFNSDFELLIAVMLSAQATDRQVNKVTQVMFAKANTPQELFDLGVEWIEDQIKSIGLFRTKAKNVWLTSQKILDDFKGLVPRDREALESLPGVGRKTANVVLNEAFGEATIAVDTHIFRVSNRLGLASGKTPNQVELKLLDVIPKMYLKGIHHWLILHGRYICRARKPLCNQCLIESYCCYTEKTT
ncbi:MAG: endonuclease III [Candidatus Comchoanobacterales bacterium]